VWNIKFDTHTKYRDCKKIAFKDINTIKYFVRHQIFFIQNYINFFLNNPRNIFKKKNRFSRLFFFYKKNKKNYILYVPLNKYLTFGPFYSTFKKKKWSIKKEVRYLLIMSKGCLKNKNPLFFQIFPLHS